MAVAAPPWLLEQLFDNDGNVLAGGKLYFKAGTAAGPPLAAYTDAGGGTAVTNPLILDSSGRCQFWLTENTAYAVILKTAADVVLETVENIVVNAATESANRAVDIYLIDADAVPPLTNQWLCGAHFRRPIEFPADFSNSGLSLDTNPTGVFVATCRKNSTAYNNGTAVGTLTVQTNGTYAFATTADAAIDVAIGDRLDWYAPTSVDASIQGFLITMVGVITGSAPGDFLTSTEVDALIATAVAAYLPPGSITAWGGLAPPSGWLECNGSEISRSTYANLFTQIGTSWGVGNGTTTFNLPDFRGKFLRAWDHGAGVDVARAQFSSQAANTPLPAHKHDHNLQFTTGSTRPFFGGADSTTDVTAGPHQTVHTDNNAPAVTGYTSTTAADTSENHPVNMAVTYIIKT